MWGLLFIVTFLTVEVPIIKFDIITVIKPLWIKELQIADTNLNVCPEKRSRELLNRLSLKASVFSVDKVYWKNFPQ